MQAWLLGKMDKLAADFLGGDGVPMIFELQYLCYMECYIAACGGDPSTFWSLYEAECEEETAEGSSVLGHYARIDDRDKLVARVLKFRGHFEGPRKMSFKALSEPEPKKTKRRKPKGAQEPTAARSTGEGFSDLFDLFGENDK